MMKKFYGVLCIGTLLFMGACQDNDGEKITPVDNGETTKVEFELDASSLAHDISTRTYTPEYVKEGFSIYAFRRTADGSDYVFDREVNLANMTYNAGRGKWVATDNLPIGTYKFIHAYGVKPQSGTSIKATAWANRSLEDGILVELNDAATSVPMNEIFLETDKDANLITPYALGVDESANQTVSGTLKRAVSRVDLMFISAVRDENGNFTEVPYCGEGGNILGGKTIENIELQFEDANNQMNIFGINATNTPSDVTINLRNNTPAWYNFNQTITIGDADETLVGTPTYFSYDNVVPADIIEGSAHIFGTYMLPNNDDAHTARVKLVIKPTVGESRIINVVTNDEYENRIPLERNKVTLIKIYVLNCNNIFSTTVEFEVEIITAWEDAHEATGIIS